MSIIDPTSRLLLRAIISQNTTQTPVGARQDVDAISEKAFRLGQRTSMPDHTKLKIDDIDMVAFLQGAVRAAEDFHQYPDVARQAKRLLAAIGVPE